MLTIEFHLVVSGVHGDDGVESKRLIAGVVLSASLLVFDADGISLGSALGGRFDSCWFRPLFLRSSAEGG